VTTKLEKIQRIRQLKSEQDRLLQTLEFYAWLEQHGTHWSEIQSLRPLDNTPRSQSEFKASCRRHGQMDLWNESNHANMVKVPTGRNTYIWQVYDPAKHMEHFESVVRRPRAYAGRFIDLKLKDGRQMILPWPPFDEDVVYNRKRAE